MGVVSSYDRWLALDRHRPALLRVALARSVSVADAEDAVAEAILRAYSFEGLDVEEPIRWLVRTTINLCHDAARDRGRAAKRELYGARLGTAEPSCEERVCDVAEATWAARQIIALPRQQRTALELKAEGAGVDELAAALGTSYKSAESLLARGRASMRAALSAARSLIPAWFCHRWARGRRLALVAVSPVALALTLGAGTHAWDHEAVTRPFPELGTTATSAVAPRRAPMPIAVHGAQSRPVPERSPVGRPVASPTRRLRGETTLSAGPVSVRDRGSESADNEESFFATVWRCLQDGPDLSPTSVGCPPR